MMDLEDMFMEAHSESIPMEDIQEYARTLGVDLSQVDLNSISLPPPFDPQECVSNISSDGGDCEDKCSNDFSNIIVVDNLPVVGPEKFGKLEGVVRRIYDQIKTGMIKEYGLWMPINPETQETVGYCFLEFNTREEAELAKKRTDGYQLDKRHKFAVTLIEEFDRLINIPEEFIVSDPEEKPTICQENLRHWLTDEKGRDQYFVQAGCQVEVYWSDPRLSNPEFLHNLEILSLVQWSPMGTYLAVADKQGVILHGGAASFDPLIHCAHPQVKLFDFSLGEKYLVTYNISSSSSPNNEQGAVQLRMFDVKTGRVINSFKKIRDLPTNGEPELLWASIRWGGGRDDMYFACMENDILHVYETGTSVKITDCLLKMKNVQGFSWSPTDPIFAASIPESRHQPARVILVDVQKKQELRQKNLFNVNVSNMYWQSNGDYLAIQVAHKRRTAKGNEFAFLIFCIREQGIPVEVLVLENHHDKIIDFSWEPKGHRFGVIHGDIMRPDISFYSLKKNANTCKVLKHHTLVGKQANTLQWSPTGRFMVIAGLKDFGGKFEFFDAHELKTLAVTEHYLATGIEWDPTGRYVATSVCCIHEFENRFVIWSFFGKLLYRMQMDHLHKFHWRPRPPSLLSAEEEHKIQQNLKEYSSKYEAEERETMTYLSEQDDQGRKMLIEEWQGWVMKWRELREKEKFLRLQIRGGDAGDEKDVLEAVEVDEFLFEEVLNIKEEVVSF